MRILHVVPTYLPAVRYGGPIVSVHGLCKALARQGNDVHVFTTNVDGPDDSAVPLGVPVEMDGVKVWYFPVPALRRLYWSPQMRNALRLHMKTFDIAHTHSVFLWPTWAAACVARRNRVPYVLSPRGMLVKELIRRKSALLKTAWISLIERRNLENAAAIHVTSRIEAEDLAAFRFNLSTVCITANGVDLSDESEAGEGSSPAIKELVAGPPYLLYLGRINWKKGIDRLIPALARLPKVQLILAGNDEEAYQPSLEALAQRLQVSNRIRFVGPVHGQDKQALLRHASALVVPSYSESFGIVVLEAMAAGCPTVVTNEVGASDIVRDTGSGVVTDGKPEALATGIEGLLRDPELGRAMGRRGRKAIEDHYSWDALARSMESDYRRVLTK